MTFRLKILPGKTPTSHFERWLCSDTQKPASVSKDRAFQEAGSTLPSALSLFIPFPHLSLSVPGNPCVWADVRPHHEHCGPSLLSSSAPYCPRFPFLLLISSLFVFLHLRYHKMDSRTERLHRFFAKRDLNLATMSNAIVIISLISFALIALISQFGLVSRFNSS